MVRTLEKRLESCVRVTDKNVVGLSARIRCSAGSYLETNFLCLRDFFCLSPDTSLNYAPASVKRLTV